MEIYSPDYDSVRDISIKEYIALEKDTVEQTMADSTAVGYKRTLRKFCDFISADNLSDITQTR